jgi:hypothetical protein
MLSPASLRVPSPAVFLLAVATSAAVAACGGDTATDEAGESTKGPGAGAGAGTSGSGGASTAGAGTSADGGAAGAAAAGGSGDVTGSGGSSSTVAAGSGGTTSTGSAGAEAAAGTAGAGPIGGSGSGAGSGAGSAGAPVCPDPGPGGPETPVTANVDVKDGDILLNGSPWEPRGMIFEGFLITREDAADCVAKGKDTPNNYCQRHLDARDYFFGQGEFACHDALVLAKKNWQIDSIRFNLNQAALDHNSPHFSQAYVDEVKKAVNHARARGFVVFAALFSQRNENGADFLDAKNPKTELSNASTKAAANTLASQFGDDRGVVIELLNEPYGPPGSGGRDGAWKLWRDGGSANGASFVGVNEIIASIRSKDAKNAVILQGVGGSFVGFPGGVVDSKNRLIYSAHPFLTAGEPEQVDWYSRFGRFANNHPFLITAWDTNTADDWCPQTGVQAPTRFVQYLHSRKWGLVGFAFDVGGSVTQNFRTAYDKPTQLGSSCSASTHGGSLVQASFLGTLPGLGNHPPVISSIDAPKQVKAGGVAQIKVTAKDPDNTGGAKERLSFAYRAASDGNGADSDREYGTINWHAPNGKGLKKLTISAVDPYGGRDEKDIQIDVQ